MEKIYSLSHLVNESKNETSLGFEMLHEFCPGGRNALAWCLNAAVCRARARGLASRFGIKPHPFI